MELVCIPLSEQYFSRKGAKTQREILRNAAALCVFAPLREKTDYEKHPVCPVTDFAYGNNSRPNLLADWRLSRSCRQIVCCGEHAFSNGAFSRRRSRCALTQRLATAGNSSHRSPHRHDCANDHAAQRIPGPRVLTRWPHALRFWCERRRRLSLRVA